MRWTTGRRGTHVEDRRGIRISRGIAGGGIGTILLVIVTLCLGLESGELARCDTSSSLEL